MKKLLITTGLTLIFLIFQNNAQTSEFSNPQDYLKKSIEFVNKGNHPEAIEVLTKGIGKFPNVSSLYIWRAKYYQWVGKQQLMENDLYQAIEVSDQKSKYNIILNAVSVFMNSRGCQIALKLLDQAMAMDSTNISGYASRANAHSCLGNNAQALNDINYVLSLEPDNVIARANKNRYLAENSGTKPDAKTNDELLIDLEEKIKNSPKNRNLKKQLAFLYYSRAYAHKKENKLKEMFADFDRAIELHPSGSFYSKRGWLYYQQKNYPKAIEDYTKAIELSKPPSYVLFNNRGDFYKLNQQYEKAKEDYEMVIKLLGEKDEVIVKKIEGIKTILIN